MKRLIFFFICLIVPIHQARQIWIYVTFSYMVRVEPSLMLKYSVCLLVAAGPNRDVIAALEKIGHVQKVSVPHGLARLFLHRHAPKSSHLGLRVLVMDL